MIVKTYKVPCTFKIKDEDHLERILEGLRENGVYVNGRDIWEEFYYENGPTAKNLGIFVEPFSDGDMGSDLIVANNCIHPIYEEDFGFPVFLEKLQF